MNGARRKSWPTGDDVVIAACGPLVGRAIEAGRQLREQGMAATVISNPFINRVDLETIGAAVEAMFGPHRHHRGPPGHLRHGRADGARAGAGGHRSSDEARWAFAGNLANRPVWRKTFTKARPDRGRHRRGGAGIAGRNGLRKFRPNGPERSMAQTNKSLQGQLILDGGKLHGSFFHRSVVLICQHDGEGRFRPDPQPRHAEQSRPGPGGQSARNRSRNSPSSWAAPSSRRP